MQQPPYGQPPGGMPPGGMPPGGQPPYGQPPYGPPGGPPQWGGPPGGYGGGPPKLPPKQGFPWAIVVVVGFLIAVGIGAYIYRQAKGNPLKEWEEGIQRQSDEWDREIERMERENRERERMLEQLDQGEGTYDLNLDDLPTDTE